MRRSAKQPEVLVVQQLLKNFRVPLHDGVRQTLATKGVDYRLVYSAAQGDEVTKGDCLNTEPGSGYQKIPLRHVGSFVWQHPPRWRHAAAIVVEQANKHLFNWYLLLNLWLLPRWCWPGRRKPQLIFWGHGYNHQRPYGFGEWVKKLQLKCPSAWLSYTSGVTHYLQQQGVAPERITTLHNSLDNQHFGCQVQLLRQQYKPDLPQTAKMRPLVLLFCGALYHDKQIPLLLQVARQLVESHVVSSLIVVGDGPLRTLLTSSNEPWLDYRGACFAEDKALAFAQADLVLNPGLVGLAILDAFAAGLPFITTDYPGHSPEISYLQSGVNGFMLPMDSIAITQAISALQQNPAQLAKLAQGARDSAELYTMSSMVSNFSRGVLQSVHND